MKERVVIGTEIEPIDDLPEAPEPTLNDRESEPIEDEEARDEEKTEGAEPYFPPTDPVLNDRGDLIGGAQGTSMDSLDVDASTMDEEPGDEALADAVRRELLQDASTSHLRLSVEVRRGVVFLRGHADDIEETDDAAEVASRVPGVRQVVEQIATPGV